MALGIPLIQPFQTAALLAVLQALRLALPQLGLARTYFEHFDVFIGTVGKMIYVYLPLPALLGWHTFRKGGGKAPHPVCTLSLQGSSRAL